MLEWLEIHQLPCLFKAIFGMECPGCGFQRALLFLLRGEVDNSVHSYPALMPILIFMVLTLLRGCGLKKISSGMLKNIGFVCLIIILISYLLILIVKE